MEQSHARPLPDGSATSPQGFSAAAVAAGIKQSGRPDLVLLVSDRECAAAGVFTRNRVAAAPVLLDRETLAAGRAALRGVIINAGNANACTGEPGLADAREMQRLAAAAAGAQPGQFLVMSTGVIGVPLPMERVRAGVDAAAPRLSAAGGAAAAEAIMTTDTHPKRAALELALAGGRVRLGGMAKGAGMIHPDMATLLAVLTTDAAVPPDDLDSLLREAVAVSFNAISVDGDTSTNDTVLLLANGASGVALAGAADRALFAAALTELCLQLAQMIVRDGEGATRFVTLVVSGAATAADARRAADAIATSPLVKTAFAGGDPNWGRILAAAGRSGAEVDPQRLGLWVGAPGAEPQQLVRQGTPAPFREADAAAVFALPEFTVRVDLGLGEGTATLWTTDLSHDYVTINADYRT